LIDTRAEEVAATQDFGEQAHLAGSTATLALDTTGRQRGFLADEGNEVIAQGVEFVSDGVKEFSATGRAQLAEFEEGIFGGRGGGIDFRVGGLMEGVGQCFASSGVEAFMARFAEATAGAADEVLTENGRHLLLLLFLGRIDQAWRLMEEFEIV
jgi:hypothetical protein